MGEHRVGVREVSILDFLARKNVPERRGIERRYVHHRPLLQLPSIIVLKTVAERADVEAVVPKDVREQLLSYARCQIDLVVRAILGTVKFVMADEIESGVQMLRIGTVWTRRSGVAALYPPLTAKLCCPKLRMIEPNMLLS